MKPQEKTSTDWKSNERSFGRKQSNIEAIFRNCQLNWDLTILK